MKKECCAVVRQGEIGGVCECGRNVEGAMCPGRGQRARGFFNPTRCCLAGLLAAAACRLHEQKKLSSLFMLLFSVLFFLIFSAILSYTYVRACAYDSFLSPKPVVDKTYQIQTLSDK